MLVRNPFPKSNAFTGENIKTEAEAIINRKNFIVKNIHAALIKIVDARLSGAKHQLPKLSYLIGLHTSWLLSATARNLQAIHRHLKYRARLSHTSRLGSRARVAVAERQLSS